MKKFENVTYSSESKAYTSWQDFAAKKGNIYYTLKESIPWKKYVAFLIMA